MSSRRYYQPTVDPLFKHLMDDDEVRNGFLSSVIGEEILKSKVISCHLNPYQYYKELRSLVNRQDISNLMESFKDTDPASLWNFKIGRDFREQRMIYDSIKFIHELAPRYYELVNVIPRAERNTQLDVLCETETGYVDIEVQITPQDYWDIRILDHACGLFHRQFGRGFKWSQLENEMSDLAVNTKRVVCISLFEKAPRYKSDITTLIPWYQVTPWDNDELRRTYRIMDINDNKKIRPGLEFHDFNLQAFHILREKQGFGDCPKGLRDWIDFFSSAQNKTEDDVERSDYNSAVKKAYKLVREIPRNLKEAYIDAMAQRQNISHYVGSMKEEGRAEGKAEGKAEGIEIGELKGKQKVVQNMLKKGFDIADIKDCTGLSISEIEKIKNAL